MHGPSCQSAILRDKSLPNQAATRVQFSGGLAALNDLKVVEHSETTERGISIA